MNFTQIKNQSPTPFLKFVLVHHEENEAEPPSLHNIA